MLKARLWIKEGSAYSTRATSDKRLNEMVKVLDRCSRGADNGSWGCVGCQEFDGCWRLYKNMVHKSMYRKLREGDSEHFNAKFAIIEEKLKEV